MKWTLALPERLKPYRIPLLVLLVGLVLLLLPDASKPRETPADPTAGESAEAAQKRLAEVLSRIDGVGRVQVLLSYRTSAETEYLADDDGTVILSAGSGTQSAVIRRTVYPRYQGAVIVCAGGDQAVVRLRVVEAVSNFTGLGAGQISVFPLRGGN